MNCAWSTVRLDDTRVVAIDGRLLSPGKPVPAEAICPGCHLLVRVTHHSEGGRYDTHPAAAVSA